ncbi:nuclear envelope integral membrane protein [Brevipalpus obovatus]|uniref:nuclear envelope integral membrane protein n=1 Tax=Brevipalpus obovatus TaxID=246614 RepID=UPI003D9F6932
MSMLFISSSFSFWLLFLCSASTLDTVIAQEYQDTSAVGVAFSKLIDENAVLLVPNEQYNHPRDSDKPIFCKPRYAFKFHHAWARAYIKFSNDSSIQDIVEASNVNEVKDKIDKRDAQFWRSSFLMPHYSPTIHTLPYLEPWCLRVCSKRAFYFTYHVEGFNPFLFAITLIGIFGFYASPSICRSVFFFYSVSGILGFVGSILILFFIVSRFIPGRVKSIFFLVGSSSVVVFFRLFWEKLTDLMMDHSTSITIYIGLSTLLSLAFAYQRGPITNTRTLDLVQWACQGLSLVAIGLSISFTPVAFALIMAMLIHRILGGIFSRIFFFLSFWKKPKLEPRTLLTEEEYTNEGKFYTQMELEKLREYCRSPDVDKWKLLHKLKSPDRFCRFVVDGQDLTEEEMFAYDSSSNDLYESSDNGDVLVYREQNEKPEELFQETENVVHLSGQRIILPDLY